MNEDHGQYGALSPLEKHAYWMNYAIEEAKKAEAITRYVSS